ncbi:MAG: hypothetical protein KGI66_04345, partial [Patescibacteria group bacterium]|nr:hypothetical protein [Patescibacteria group bacterium]
DLYASNEEAWLAMLHDCAHAERSIVLEQFIFVDDDFGRKLMNVCAERASHGVKVRFLWDAAGSFSFFGSDIAAELKEKGIEVLFWKTLVPSYFKVSSIRSWFLRNHRRTLVVDGRIGYTGSICVSDALRNWRDTNVRVEGRVAADMENAFERMWHRAKKSKKLPPRKPSGDPDFRYLTNYPAPGRRHIYSTIIKAFKNARHYAYVTTPYFVPTHRLFNAIREAAERGVDVRLIIPERSNHYPALDIGARSFFSPLLEAGARIFLYPSVDGQIIHSKTIVVDGDWSTVGSMNLDSVSLLYNFEANIVSNDTRFAEELAAHFVRDMNASKEVSLEEWKSRLFVEKIPETLIKLVRKFL